jgi:hypothetical protein
MHSTISDISKLEKFETANNWQHPSPEPLSLRKKFTAFYANRGFVTTITTARHLPLFYDQFTQSTQLSTYVLKIHV